MSHEKGGSYCIDSNGSFHFVKGYTHIAVGTEVTIKSKSRVCLRRLMLLAAGLVVVFLIYGIACGFPIISRGMYSDCPHYAGTCREYVENCINRCVHTGICIRN